MLTRLKRLVVGLLVVVVAHFAHVESTAVSITETLSSCINQPLLPELPNLLLPELPNLSHAKANVQFILPNLSCNITELTSISRTYTWYYYQTYPVIGCPENQCCFNTTTSTASFTTVVRKLENGNAVITSTGTIVDGTYIGKNVTTILVSPITDQTACSTPPGRQILSGSQTLTIVGGPSCTGIQVAEYCPGIH